MSYVLRVTEEITVDKKKIVRLDPVLFNEAAQYASEKCLTRPGAGPSEIVESCLMTLLSQTRLRGARTRGGVRTWLDAGGQEVLESTENVRNSNKSSDDIPQEVIDQIERTQQELSGLEDLIPDRVEIRQPEGITRREEPWSKLKRMTVGDAQAVAGRSLLFKWYLIEPNDKLRKVATECAFGSLSKFLWNTERGVQVAEEFYRSFKIIS